MPYQMASGRVARGDSVTLAASAARTATGNGTAFEVGDKTTLRCELNVTAVSGTAPTLVAAVETSANGTSGWTEIAAFSQVTATGTTRKVFTGLDRFVRPKWTIGGTTPSFTFALTAEMV